MDKSDFLFALIVAGIVFAITMCLSAAIFGLVLDFTEFSSYNSYTLPWGLQLQIFQRSFQFGLMCGLISIPIGFIVALIVLAMN